MKPDSSGPPSLIRKGKELSLSMKTTVELLQAVLDRGVPFRFKARGFSMSPFIKDEDVITVSPLESSSIRKGDVVAFTHPKTGRLAVHRVIHREGEFYLIKGDNTAETDGLVPLTNILGRVTAIERRGKRMHLGLGPERFVITHLTSGRLFFSLTQFISRLFRRIKKRGAQNG